MEQSENLRQSQINDLKSLSARLGVLLLLGISACTVHDPYSSQRDRAPVEVRRGETYGKPSYQGRPAPTVNRPVYIPEHRGSAPYDALPNNSEPSDSEPYNFESQQNREDSPPAVARLVAQAEAAIKAEDYVSAAARAESALRLDPQSVSAYHTLARTYLFEGRYAESEQMALRAVSFIRTQKPNAGHNTSRNLWLLIAETRRNRGDHEGAERAMERAGGRY